MSLDDLVKLIPPPKSPVGFGGAIDWPTIESQLNLRLPTDYKQLIDLYGIGHFPGDLAIYHPYADCPDSLLKDALVDTAENDRLTENARDRPYSFYPNCPGLFACGHSYMSSGKLFWLTTSSDQLPWSTVAASHEMYTTHDYIQINASLTDFLVAIYSGSLQVPFWQFLSKPFRRIFVPYNPRP